MRDAALDCEGNSHHNEEGDDDAGQHQQAQTRDPSDELGQDRYSKTEQGERLVHCIRKTDRYVSYPDRPKDKRAAEQKDKKDRCHCFCRRSPPLTSEVLKHPFLSSMENFFAPFSFVLVFDNIVQGMFRLLATSWVTSEPLRNT